MSTLRTPAPADGDGVPQGVPDAPAHILSHLPVGALEQHGELTVPHACNRVRGPHGATQPPGRDCEQVVNPGVHGEVGGAAHIDQHDGEHAVGALRAYKRVIDAIREQQAAGEAGARVDQVGTLGTGPVQGRSHVRPSIEAAVAVRYGQNVRCAGRSVDMRKPPGNDPRRLSVWCGPC
jgi:hypothetical protein